MLKFEFVFLFNLFYLCLHLLLIFSAGPLKKAKCRIFYDLNDQYPLVSVVGLGPHNATYNELEEVDEDRENVRNAVAIGVRALRNVGNGNFIFKLLTVDVKDSLIYIYNIFFSN